MRIAGAIKTLRVPPVWDFTRELLEDILEGEEEHVDWIEKQNEMIARMGLENYVQLQSEASGS